MRLKGRQAALICVMGILGAATVISPASGANPWLQQQGILNMAHQGGEMEAPSSTMYAFRTALEDRGADTLEMDVHLTADGRLAVIHDEFVDRTTSGTGPVHGKTLAEVQALDAAHWFSPGEKPYDHSLDPAAYPLRGVRTGERPPPRGYRPEDFRVPVLEEVLDAFPKVPLNIEIKTREGAGNGWYARDVAATLGELLRRPAYRDRRIIVASFDQAAIESFHAVAPGVGVSAGLGAMMGFLGGLPITPDPVALQVPTVLGGLDLPKQLQEMNVRGMGYAVHAWTDSFASENDSAYAHAIASGVQGIMTSAPARLHRYLCESGIRRPDGAPRCAGQRVTFRLRLPSLSLRRLVRRGLPVRARCSGACRLELDLRIRRKTARRLGIKGRSAGGLTVIGRKRQTMGKAGTGIVRVPLSARPHRRLSRVKRLRVRVTVRAFDRSGWPVGVRRKWLALKQPIPARR